MSNEIITPLLGDQTRPRARRRRLDNFRPWRGFFRGPNVDPTREYDPEHFCLNWNECCSKNILLKPTILSKLERDPSSTAHKKKLKWIEDKLNEQNKNITDNLKNDYKSKHEVDAIISRLKTYIWYANELAQIKDFDRVREMEPPAPKN